MEWGHCAKLRTDKQGRALCTQIHFNLKKVVVVKWRKQAAQISLNKMCIGVSPSLKRNCHIWHTVQYSTVQYMEYYFCCAQLYKSDVDSISYTAVCKVFVAQADGRTRLVIKQLLAKLSCAQNAANRHLQQRGLTGVSSRVRWRPSYLQQKTHD